MKRILIITSFFVLIFGLLCVTSCACDCNETITVENTNTGQPETFEGCYNSCIDCYWYPKMCGCYENDLQNDYFRGCMPSSCVVCGCDLTLLECYRKSDDKGTDVETRQITAAAEDVNYVIDKMTVIVNGNVKEFYDVGMNWDDISDAILKFISLMNLETAAQVEFHIEYTALTELHSAEFEAYFEYNDVMDMLNNTLKKVSVKQGNGDKSYAGESNLKSKNIQPGKHIMSVTASLNMYEVIGLKDISNAIFSAKAYVEE